MILVVAPEHITLKKSTENIPIDIFLLITIMISPSKNHRMKIFMIRNLTDFPPIVYALSFENIS